MFGKKLALFLGTLILLLAACQPVSIEAAKAQLCADLGEFHAAMGAVEALTAESTVADAEAALELVADTWRDVVNSADVVRDANYDSVDQALEDLDDALRDIDEAESIDDAAAIIQTQLESVSAAYDEFHLAQCAGM